MAGRRPWSELRAQLSPDARAACAAWVAARRDLAFAVRERRAALLLDAARGPAAYDEAPRAVRADFELDSDEVPHDPPPGWPVDQ